MGTGGPAAVHFATASSRTLAAEYLILLKKFKKSFDGTIGTTVYFNKTHFL
jgi:hypothetical protein